jgi:hypothetical protein
MYSIALHGKTWYELKGWCTSTQNFRVECVVPGFYNEIATYGPKSLIKLGM